MARERVIDFLPEIYRPFLPDFFQRPIREERHATCGECTMCAPAVPLLPAEAYFSPSTKCCTYHPALPNYSVGGLLHDTSAAGAEGRRRILQKIEARTGVTPAGIMPPARTMLLRSHGQRAFGRADALVCPYLNRDRGACTVWAHREAECATWFCKHNEGFDGRAFWKQLRDYLAGVHLVLSTWVLRELGFDPDRIAEGFGTAKVGLDARDLDDKPPSDQAYEAVWGNWRGREQELFLAAYRMVCSLDATAFASLVGVHHDLTLDRLGKRHDAMYAPRLPDPLIRNPELRVDRGSDGSYILTAGDAGEATRLRHGLYGLLDHFDGRRPNAEVREAVRRETGVGVSDSFLTALYHHRILLGA